MDLGLDVGVELAEGGAAEYERMHHRSAKHDVKDDTDDKKEVVGHQVELVKQVERDRQSPKPVQNEVLYSTFPLSTCRSGIQYRMQ